MTSKNKKTIDKKPIEDLSLLLDELNLTEISYKEGDFAISVSRAVKSVVSNSSSTNTADTQNQGINEGYYSSDPRAIKSPMVGTVYLQPEPGANTFVKEGDQVSLGDALFFDKINPDVKWPSIASGTISKIVFGERRAVLDIIIEVDEGNEANNW